MRPARCVVAPAQASAVLFDDRPGLRVADVDDRRLAQVGEEMCGESGADSNVRRSSTVDAVWMIEHVIDRAYRPEDQCRLVVG